MNYMITGLIDGWQYSLAMFLVNEINIIRSHMYWNVYC